MVYTLCNKYAQTLTQKRSIFEKQCSVRMYIIFRYMYIISIYYTSRLSVCIFKTHAIFLFFYILIFSWTKIVRDKQKVTQFCFIFTEYLYVYGQPNGRKSITEQLKGVSPSRGRRQQKSLKQDYNILIFF